MKSAGDLDIQDGKIYRKDLPSQSIQISDVFTPVGTVKSVGEIVGRGEFTSAAPPVDIKTGRFEKLAHWVYGAHAAEVAVNIETGYLLRQGKAWIDESSEKILG